MKPIFTPGEVKDWLKEYTGLRTRQVKQRVPDIKDSLRALTDKRNRDLLERVHPEYRLACLELVTAATQNAYFRADTKYPHPKEEKNPKTPKEKVHEVVQALNNNLPYISDEHMLAFLELGTKIARNDVHSAYRFIEKTHHFNDIPEEHHPHLLESMHRLAEKHPDTLASLIHISEYYLNEVYKAYVPYLIDIMTVLAEQNGSGAIEQWSRFQGVIHNIPFKQANAAFLGIKRVAERRPDYFDRIVCTLETTLERIDEKDLSPDEFLIESIKDTKDAHVLGSLVDKTRYGKQYAERVALFY